MLVKTTNEDYINLTQAHLIHSKENRTHWVKAIPLRGNFERHIKAFNTRQEAQALLDEIARQQAEGRKIYQR